MKGKSEECTIHRGNNPIHWRYRCYNNSTETRPHRKSSTYQNTHTHTDISHLGIYSRTKNCRQVENNWKQYQKALFDHYVILVMKRHRRDVTILKAKKEREVLVVIIIIIIVACNNVEDEKYNIMIPPLCLLFKLLILF